MMNIHIHILKRCPLFIKSMHLFQWVTLSPLEKQAYYLFCDQLIFRIPQGFRATRRAHCYVLVALAQPWSIPLFFSRVTISLEIPHVVLFKSIVFKIRSKSFTVAHFQTCCMFHTWALTMHNGCVAKRLRSRVNHAGLLQSLVLCGPVSLATVCLLI